MLGNDRKAVEASLLFKNFTVTGFCEKSQARRFVLRNFALLCDAN